MSGTEGGEECLGNRERDREREKKVKTCLDPRRALEGGTVTRKNIENENFLRCSFFFFRELPSGLLAASWLLIGICRARF